MAEAVLTPTTSSEITWTVERAERTAPECRYEILDGELYMAAAPFFPHAEVVDNLYQVLRDWVRPRGLGRVLGAQTGLYLNSVNYLDPDLVYLRPEQLPRRKGERHTRAALAVEVLSPSNLRGPRDQREARLQQLGVEEIWYVDYDAHTLEVRRLTEDGYETNGIFRDGDTVSTHVLPGLAFPLTAVWEEIDE